jgi:hypothetical protein
MNLKFLSRIQLFEKIYFILIYAQFDFKIFIKVQIKRKMY